MVNGQFRCSQKSVSGYRRILVLCCKHSSRQKSPDMQHRPAETTSLPFLSRRFPHRVLGKTLRYIPRSPRSLSYLVSRSSRPRPHLLSKGDDILDKTHSKRKGNDGPGSWLLPGSEFGAFAHGFGLPLCAFHGRLALGTGDRGIEMTPLAPPVPGAVRFARPRGRQDVPCDCGRLRRFRFGCPRRVGMSALGR